MRDLTLYICLIFVSHWSNQEVWLLKRFGVNKWKQLSNQEGEEAKSNTYREAETPWQRKPGYPLPRVPSDMRRQTELERGIGRGLFTASWSYLQTFYNLRRIPYVACAPQETKPEGFYMLTLYGGEAAIPGQQESREKGGEENFGKVNSLMNCSRG